MPASFTRRSTRKQSIRPRTILAEKAVLTVCGEISLERMPRSNTCFGACRAFDTPVLLTSNPLGTPVAAISDPNDPSTQTLVGGSELGDWAHSGVRLRFGKVVNDGRLSRWELSGWSLFERSDSSFLNQRAAIRFWLDRLSMPQPG